MNQKPVIIFDWDGTIADSMDLCVEEVRQTLEAMRLPVPSVKTMQQCNGPTFEECVDLLGIPHDRTQEYMDVRQTAGLRLCPIVNRLYPGIRELLHDLCRHAHLCIASNGTPEYIAECHQCFGTGEYFTLALASKPGRSKTQAVKEILDTLQPRKAVMVGDRLGDINAGQSNGIPAIAVSYGYGARQEWDVADQVACSVEELRDMLEQFIQEA